MFARLVPVTPDPLQCLSDLGQAGEQYRHAAKRRRRGSDYGLASVAIGDRGAVLGDEGTSRETAIRAFVELETTLRTAVVDRADAEFVAEFKRYPM